MPFYVYAISSTGRNYIYVGISENFKKRFAQHQNGHNKTTKPYRPFVLFYVKEFNSRKDARVHEKYLKGGSGKEYLKKLLLDGETCLPAGGLADTLL